MKKKVISCMAAVALAVLSLINPMQVQAEPAGGVSVQIVSPEGVSAQPIYNGNVEVLVSNSSNQTLTGADLFLSVVDAERKQSFPMDEFGENSYQSRTIDTLAPGEQTTISIPVRVMYVGDFRIVANLVDYATNASYVSNALSLNMTSDSHLNKNLVMTVAVITPVLLAAFAAVMYKKRGRIKK